MLMLPLIFILIGIILVGILSYFDEDDYIILLLLVFLMLPIIALSMKLSEVFELSELDSFIVFISVAGVTYFLCGVSLFLGNRLYISSGKHQLERMY